MFVHGTRLGTLTVMLAALSGCGLFAKPEPIATDEPPTPTPAPPPPEDCTSGADDDLDGLADCDDPDCDAVCPYPAGFPVSLIPDDAWPALCADHAVEREGALIDCVDFTIQIEAASTSEVVAECLAAWAGNIHPTCTATWSDLEATLTWEPDDWCTFTYPPEVEAMLDCLSPAEPTPPPACALVASAYPADGAPNAFYRTEVVFELSDPDPTAGIVLTDGAGATVPGTTTHDGDRVVFAPTDPLQTSASFDATLTFCAGTESASTSFTTSTTGAAITPGSASGTHELDFDAGWFPGSSPFAMLLVQQFDASLALEVAVTASTVDILVGSATDTPPVQDVCFPTSTFSASFSTNPWFQTSPGTLTIGGDDIVFELQDAVVSGAFSPDGLDLVHPRIEATLDTRTLVPVLAPGEPDDAVCNLVATLGDTCLPCPDGSGDYCLPFLYAQDVAERVTLDVVPAPIASCP